MKRIFLLGTLGLSLLSACHTSGEKHTGHDHEETEAHGHNGNNEIVLSPEQAQAAGIKINEVSPSTFHQVIKTSGQILAAQGDERMAVATVTGVVNLKGQVVEGMRINKGDALLVLSSNNMAEGDPVEKARIAYEVAQKEYERMKTLVADRIVSEKDFARAKETYENARISYEAVAKNQSPNGQVVTAPISGYIKKLLVKEGDYVNVGQPVVSITQNRRLFLRADVSEKYYKDLGHINSANFRTPYDNTVYSLEELNGRLLSYGKASGDDSYYIPITFEFDNRGEVIPGSFVEIYLLSASQQETLTLPESALTEEQGSFFVYRQLDKECYQKQLVTVGATDGERIQILSGIQAGDRIVTEGAYQVKLASASNAIPAHTHEH